MDWFLYDNGLRHERDKQNTRYLEIERQSCHKQPYQANAEVKAVSIWREYRQMCIRKQ